MKNLSNKIERPEISKEKKEAERIKAEMTEYKDGLKTLADQKQEELNRLLDQPRSRRDDVKIQAVKKELAEIDGQVVELEETLKFMNESGDTLEVEIKR